ncbi:hypothetical protein P691DRAFT_812766 [Macrolepiota fuliginosa MF-IS2]|uniref:Uncharacterized protein n=1 Tax=Macrolepiota fuliginosa MF-IS2 TaxID=1400762 RepID=A0A9P5XGQ8_9AGAR|nr:hypothetical protein P691DRAFT_812766 [Macrolepiota fuliginosa MF-IS2]
MKFIFAALTATTAVLVITTPFIHGTPLGRSFVMREDPGPPPELAPQLPGGCLFICSPDPFPCRKGWSTQQTGACLVCCPPTG